QGCRELDADLPRLAAAAQRLLAAVARARGGDRRLRSRAAEGGDAETLGGLEGEVERGLGSFLRERQAEVEHRAGAERHRPRQGDDIDGGIGARAALLDLDLEVLG